MNNTIDKIITLPSDPQEIIGRLMAVNDEDTLVRKLYPIIVKKAGSEIQVPYGINMMFQLAISDYMEYGYPPMIGNILQLHIPRWIEALIDDDEAVDASKQLLQHINDEVKVKILENTPPRVEPEGPIEEYDLYVVARHIGDIFFEYVDTFKDNYVLGRLRFEDWRENHVMTTYYQTDSGLFLEYSYGMPDKVWTPLGSYHFCGSGGGNSSNYEVVSRKFMAHFVATEHSPLINNIQGSFGPVYALHRVDDIDLPEPRVRERQNYLEYEVAHAAWTNMTERYNAEHGGITPPNAR